jgi:hypothetical protein
MGVLLRCDRKGSLHGDGILIAAVMLVIILSNLRVVVPAASDFLGSFRMGRRRLRTRRSDKDLVVHGSWVRC